MKRLLFLLTSMILLNINNYTYVAYAQESTPHSDVVFSYAQKDTTAWELTEDGILTISGIGTVVDRLPYSYDNQVLEIVVQDGVTTIGAHCFSNLPNLRRVTLGSTVRTIEVSAFSGCTNLKSITFNEGLETIGKNAFGGCTSLETVDFPSTLKVLDTGAFQMCTSLTKVVLNLGLSTVGDYAFSDCNNLSLVKVSKSVKYIGAHAFTTGYSHNYVDSMKSIIVPKSVDYIGEGAFGVNYVQSDDSAIVYPVEGFTVYGYSGSVAEEYVDSTNLTITQQSTNGESTGLLRSSSGYNPKLLRFVKLGDADSQTTLNYLALLNLKKSTLRSNSRLLDMLVLKYELY